MIKQYTDLDMTTHVIKNAAFESGDALPTNPVDKQYFFDTSDDALKYYDSTKGEWVTVGGGLKFKHLVGTEFDAADTAFADDPAKTTFAVTLEKDTVIVMDGYTLCLDVAAPTKEGVYYLMFTPAFDCFLSFDGTPEKITAFTDYMYKFTVSSDKKVVVERNSSPNEILTKYFGLYYKNVDSGGNVPLSRLGSKAHTFSYFTSALVKNYGIVVLTESLDTIVSRGVPVYPVNVRLAGQTNVNNSCSYVFFSNTSTSIDANFDGSDNLLYFRKPAEDLGTAVDLHLRGNILALFKSSGKITVAEDNAITRGRTGICCSGMFNSNTDLVDIGTVFDEYNTYGRRIRSQMFYMTFKNTRLKRIPKNFLNNCTYSGEMSCYQMFAYTDLVEVEDGCLSGLEKGAEGVFNCSGMFEHCEKLTRVGDGFLSKITTPVSASYIFSHCYRLKYVADDFLSSVTAYNYSFTADTGQSRNDALSLRQAFEYCYSLEYLPSQMLEKTITIDSTLTMPKSTFTSLCLNCYSLKNVLFRDSFWELCKAAYTASTNKNYMFEDAYSGCKNINIAFGSGITDLFTIDTTSHTTEDMYWKTGYGFADMFDNLKQADLKEGTYYQALPAYLG